MGLSDIPLKSRVLAVEEVLGDLLLLITQQEPALRPKLLAMMAKCAETLSENEEPDAAEAVEIMRESFKFG